MRPIIICLITSLLLTCSPCLAGQEISAKLGKQDSSFGAVQQASSLLKLVEANPGATQYRITYYTDTEVVVFGCNLENDNVLRIRSDMDGNGQSEEWIGHSLFRIRNVAAGGSLDNTPEGMQPGTMERF